jgi:hypothetical protein
MMVALSRFSEHTESFASQVLLNFKAFTSAILAKYPDFVRPFSGRRSFQDRLLGMVSCGNKFARNVHRNAALFPHAGVWIQGTSK